MIFLSKIANQVCVIPFIPYVWAAGKTV